MVELTLADLLTVGGLSLLVTILVQLAKPYLPEKQIPLFSIAVGVLVAVVTSLALGRVGAEPVGQAILTGVLGGAAAIGIYQLQQPTGLLKPKA